MAPRVPVAEGVKRVGLLTQREKMHLKSASIDKKVLSKLQRKLTRRYEAFYDDFLLIMATPHLTVWRSLNKLPLDKVIELDRQRAMAFQPLYFDYVRYSWNEHNGKRHRVYWMEQYREKSVLKNITKRRNVLNPSFSLRNIRANIDVDTFQFLEECVKKQLIPFGESNSLTEMVLREKLARS